MGSSPPCRRSPATDQLEITPANEQKVLVGTLEKRGPYVFRPRLGAWLGIIATVLGRSPWLGLKTTKRTRSLRRPLGKEFPTTKTMPRECGMG